mmetsp:Transcript_24049/g.54701  ORF Transcript_24049/g.54701 Transcript_24049/m.54701 type:complete len:401 (-) Transcript_24049:31-1233(-)
MTCAACSEDMRGTIAAMSVVACLFAFQWLSQDYMHLLSRAQQQSLSSLNASFTRTLSDVRDQLRRNEALVVGLVATQSTFVIASCMSDLRWAAPLARAGHTVVVLEKCKPHYMSDLGGAAPKGFTNHTDKRPRALEYVDLSALNKGRESHSYLWFIVNRWDRLPQTIVFLQGDAPDHVRHGATESCASYLLTRVRDFVAGKYSYLSLNHDMKIVPHFPSAGRFGWDGHSYCQMYRAFTHSQGRCHAWVAARYAHFAVASRTVKRHPLRAYERLLRTFEDDLLATKAFPRYGTKSRGRAHGKGGYVVELSWNLIFGCVRTVTRRPHTNCSFSTENLHADGGHIWRFCPANVASEWKHMDGKRYAHRSHNHLAFDEDDRNGCVAFHNLSHDVRGAPPGSIDK